MSKSNLAATSASNINPSTSQKAEDMPKINKADLSADVAEYIEELEKSLTEATDLIDELTDEELEEINDEDDTEEVEGDVKTKVAALAKSDPALAAFISKMDSDLAAARADIAKSQETIAKERKVRVMGEMVSKAATYSHLNISKSDLGVVLYELYETDAELATKVDDILKAANAQLESADIFNEIGKSATGGTVSSSVEAAAAEIRKSEPGLTEEQALAKAYEQNPSLYIEHMKGIN